MHGILFSLSAKLYRVMIIDLDAHQGNGHEMDFYNDSMISFLSSLCVDFLEILLSFFTNRTSLYSGYVQPWDISICKSPCTEIALHSLGASIYVYI